VKGGKGNHFDFFLLVGSALQQTIDDEFYLTIGRKAVKEEDDGTTLKLDCPRYDYGTRSYNAMYLLPYVVLDNTFS